MRGEAAEQILEFMEASGADLCAMATHGRSGVSRWIRGSVAERVLRNATIPVFLANPKGLVLETDDVCFERILVPYDGSKLAAQILPLVGRFASDSGAEVIVLHIDMPERGGHPVPEVARRHAQQRAEAMLDEVRCHLEDNGVEKTQVIGRYSEDPANEILQVIEEVKPDLVAMSSHGRSGVSRFAFGSVAEKVLRHCDCPLLVKPVRRKL
jgi:nucleotide-binding universal stress UspA family protein